MKVSDIMNKAFAIPGSMSLKEAARIMSNKNIGSLIVMNNDKILGIVTERDVLKNVSSLGNKVSSVMTEELITIEASDNIDNAAMLMGKHKIKRLPVLKKGKLAGIVTATDVLANSDSLNEEFLLE